MTEPAIEVETIACPICGSTRDRPVCVTRDYVYGIAGEYRFVRCRGCQHVYMNPRPTDASIMACYPAGYGPHVGAIEADGPELVSRISHWRRLRRWIGTVTGLRQFICWLFDERGTFLPLPPRPGHSRLLEIGCAHGGYLQRAASFGWIVDGIEPSRAAAELAVARGIPVFVGKFEQANLASESRDAIAAWMVLEHVPDPLAFLRTAYRALVPGGVLALSVPNSGSVERGLFGRFWQGYDPPRHLQVFSAAELRRVLGEVGFEHVRVIYQPGLRDTYAGLAAWGIERFPDAEWPVRLMRVFRGDTPLWLKLVSIGPARILAAMHVAGRITVVARK